MRSGQLDLETTIGFIFMLIAVIAIWSFGLPSAEGVKTQVNDIKPYYKSTFLANNLEQTYVEPAYRYAFQEAAYRYGRADRVWGMGGSGDDEVWSYSTLEDGLKDEAAATLRRRLRMDMGKDCQFVNEGNLGYGIRDSEAVQDGDAGTVVTFDMSTPLGVECNVQSANFTGYIPVEHKHFLEGNRYLRAARMASALAADTSWETPFVDMPYGFTDTEDVQTELATRLSDAADTWETDFRSGDSDYRDFDIGVGVNNVEKKPSGDWIANVSLSVRDTRYTVPVDSGERHITFSATYEYEAGDSP